MKIIKNINGKEHFVQKIYKELFNLSITNPNCLTWVSGIKTLLESTGFSYIWQQQFVINEREFLKCFKQRLTDIYIDNTGGQKYSFQQITDYLSI